MVQPLTPKSLLGEIEASINNFHEISTTDYQMVYLQLIDLIKEACSQCIPNSVEVEESEEHKEIYEEGVEEAAQDLNRICIVCAGEKEGLIPNCQHFLCKDCLEEAMRSASKRTFNEETFFTTPCPVCQLLLQPGEILNVFDWNWLSHKHELVVQEEHPMICPIDLLPLSDPQSILQLPCGHDFHLECMKDYIIEKLRGAGTKFICPCEGCNTVIGNEIIEKMIPAEVLLAIKDEGEEAKITDEDIAVILSVPEHVEVVRVPKKPTPVKFPLGKKPIISRPGVRKPVIPPKKGVPKNPMPSLKGKAIAPRFGGKIAKGPTAIIPAKYVPTNRHPISAPMYVVNPGMHNGNTKPAESLYFTFEGNEGGGQVSRLSQESSLYKQVSTHFIQKQKNTRMRTKIIWSINKVDGDIAFMRKLKQNFTELNIQYLYHGTTEEAIDSIIHKTGGTGFQLPSSEGNLGKGLYFAPDPGKCMSYCRDSKCLIIRAMVCLGVRDKHHKSGTFGGNYLEYCVFSQDQCQPCEIILYNT